MSASAPSRMSDSFGFTVGSRNVSLRIRWWA